MNTQGSDVHVFEDIEEKEYEGEVVVDSDNLENTMNATTI